MNPHLIPRNEKMRNLWKRTRRSNPDTLFSSMLTAVLQRKGRKVAGTVCQQLISFFLAVRNLRNHLADSHVAPWMKLHISNASATKADTVHRLCAVIAPLKLSHLRAAPSAEVYSHYSQSIIPFKETLQHYDLQQNYVEDLNPVCESSPCGSWKRMLKHALFQRQGRQQSLQQYQNHM